MSSGVLKSLNGVNKAKENSSEQPKKLLQKVQPSTSSVKQTNKSKRTVLASKENIFLNPSEERKASTKAFLKGSHSSSSKPRKVKIFDESLQLAKKYKSTATQTENEDDKALICSEDPTEKYWELLAEERRKALLSALEENKQLADEIESKDVLIEDMKLEMDHLEEVASHTHYLQSVIEELMRNNELIADDADVVVPTNSPESVSYSDIVAHSTLDTTDGNDQYPRNRISLSEDSCSHDSDKENKPPVEFLPLCDDSSDD